MNTTARSIFQAARLPFLSLAALATLQAVAVGQTAGAVIASGSGHYFVENGLRNFSFTAVRKPNGSVGGQMEQRNPDTGIRLHVTVDCAVVVPVAGVGDVAVMSGVVTSPVFTGSTAVWAVVDRGEGAGAPPDEITLVNGLAPFPVPNACHIVVNTPELFPFLLAQLGPIANGNILVF